MFKPFIALVLVAVAVGVWYFGTIALVAVIGLSLGLIMAEVVDVMGKDATGRARRGGEGRVKSRDLD